MSTPEERMRRTEEMHNLGHSSNPKLCQRCFCSFNDNKRSEEDEKYCVGCYSLLNDFPDIGDGP